MTLIAITMAFLASLAFNCLLMWWLLRSDGRIKPTAIERTEAIAKIPIKTSGKSYGGKVL